jgi:hypothetical protein
MPRYSRDPYWLTLKYDATIEGAKVPRGTRVFYYPTTKRMLAGEKAEQAAADFEAAAADESFMSGY